jgi:lipoyl(octanoyl) transferase
VLTASSTLRWTYLGRVPYREALALQLRLRQAIRAGSSPDTLLLVEHPPVITLGRHARPDHVLASPAQLARLGIERVAVERGGDVTYHGPGQLVGYPLRRVGRAIREHLRGIAQALLGFVGERGIPCRWRGDAPGIWTPAGKVAAVGIDARQRVAMHGFALNLDPDLSHYGAIVPCGLSEPVTSLRQLGVDPPPLSEAARELAGRLADAYGDVGREISPIDLEATR